MRFETIVLGTDGSENANRALEVARDLAASSGGVVHIVCAHDTRPPHEVVQALKHLPEEYWDVYDPRSVQQEVLEKAAARLDETGVRHVSHLIEKHPVSAIFDVADEVDADLIVVGNRGTGWPTRLTRGSVSSRIANHTERSVLIVHHE